MRKESINESLLLEPSAADASEFAEESRPQWPGQAERPAGLLHELFETQADLRPGNVAVKFGAETLTYGELERRANRLGRHLRALGVRRGARVAILLPRSADAYVTLLGILKAGAAYVPLDLEYPAERVAFILENSEAAALVTTEELAAQHTTFAGLVIRMDADRATLAEQSSARLHRNSVGIGTQDLCYIIYTSGSTGRPKGVMVEHRSAHHLVSAEGDIFGVLPVDRVYQGFSLCFDASVEEVWLAFRAGATLVAATPAMAHAGPDLSRMLSDAGVTVFSCVPTLLSMLGEDVPGVRLLILGGEACPEHLVERWAKFGRRMVNTYGPTEATVIATYADLVPGKPVTIGRSVSGYRVQLLDDELRPVPRGQTGEICIGGVGVARGYVGLPGLTRERFLTDPSAAAHQREARIYRTGDLGRLNAEGEIEFLGRADSQVKLRGFRIELAEIESALLQGDGLLATACAVRQGSDGVQQLVAYVVPRPDGKVDEEYLRAYLRNRLPAYMIPALIETVGDLPRLPSGKLDRAALPEPQSRATSPQSKSRRAQTPTELYLAAVWKRLFHPQPVNVDDDFFLDLGGHSLLAARMVSELRKVQRFAAVAMADVYDHPTIASLASALDTGATRCRPTRPLEIPATVPAPTRADARRRHFIGGLLQACALYVVFGFRGLQWVTPYLVYFLLVESGYPVLPAASWAAASAMIMLPALILIAVAAKWILLGRIQPGRYPLWGGFYVRWWFVQNLISALHLDDLSGTPLLPFVFRLFGARIGRDVHLESDDLAAFDVTSIGAGTSVDDKAWILGSAVERDELVIGSVEIGQNCFVGTRSVVRENTVMEDGARLDDLSLLQCGARIPCGETWAGSPARPATNTNPAHPPRPVRSLLQRVLTTGLFVVLVLVVPVLPLCAFVPGVMILTHIDPLAEPLKYLATLPVIGASFVLLLTLGTASLKWLLVGRVRPGTHPVYGAFYLRKWVVDQLLALSLDTAGSLHATLYLPLWYRALGARLGRLVELSTATSMTPDLLAIGDGGTVADEASLSSARIEGGWMTLAPIKLGQRSFVGNGAVMPAGAVLGDHSLVGVLSVPPAAPDAAVQNQTSWLGSPAIRLPRREASTPFSDQRTYCPSRKLLLTRAVVELLRITLPPAGFIFVASTVVAAALSLWGHFGLGAMLLLPLVYGAACGTVALAAAAAKWMLMGRFRPFVHPLWSVFVWRLEFANALYEFLVTPLALEGLQGTPFLPWYYRLLGAKIGRRTYFHTTGLIEFDLVEVGDEAVVNEDCVLQTHLFADRVLKASALRVGRGCVMGAGSVVLYDSWMEDGSRLDALSLLMKGEVLPANTNWAGSPAQRMER